MGIVNNFNMHGYVAIVCALLNQSIQNSPIPIATVRAEDSTSIMVTFPHALLFCELIKS